MGFHHEPAAGEGGDNDMSPGIVTFFICLSLEGLCAGCFPCQEGISVVGLSQNIVLKAHLPFKK